MSKKVFTSGKKKQDVNRLKRRIFCFWSSQYSLLLAHVPWFRGPNWFNSLRNRSINKLNGKLASFYRQIQKFSQHLLARLIVSTFQCRNFHSDEIRFHFFNWDCFKIVVANNIKLHSSFVFPLNKDFNPQKPHFCVRIFALPRVTRNTKLHYSLNCSSLFLTFLNAFRCRQTPCLAQAPKQLHCSYQSPTREKKLLNQYGTP